MLAARSAQVSLGIECAVSSVGECFCAGAEFSDAPACADPFGAACDVEKTESESAERVSPHRGTGGTGGNAASEPFGFGLDSSAALLAGEPCETDDSAG